MATRGIIIARFPDRKSKEARPAHDGMSEMNNDRINIAIRDCVQRCFSGGSVIARTAAFLRDLRASGSWDKADIRAVEIGVHRMLQRMLAGETFAGDATDQPVSNVNQAGRKTIRVIGA